MIQKKLVKLIDIFVKASSNKNDIIFDPFMGSGTTAVSAKKNGRKYLGFELSPVYHGVISNRLKDTISEVKLTDFKN